jgi:RIO kinase 1
MIDTTKIIELASDLGHTIKVVHQLKSGKEATVFKVDMDGALVAMKVYHQQETNNFKNNTVYTENNFYKQKSHEKAVAKKTKFGKSLQFNNWVTTEYEIMELLYQAGCSIPKPLFMVGNAVFMELLGDEFITAPRLQEINLKKYSKEKITEFFTSITKVIETLLKAGHVHGDLSSFNVMIWNDTAYVIDFPQTIDISNNSNAAILLTRDLHNICNTFGKYIDTNEFVLLAQYLEQVAQAQEHIHIQ